MRLIGVKFLESESKIQATFEVTDAEYNIARNYHSQWKLWNPHEGTALFEFRIVSDEDPLKEFMDTVYDALAKVSSSDVWSRYERFADAQARYEHS